jgi:capsular exopolysaccharide synthesis family protein
MEKNRKNNVIVVRVAEVIRLVVKKLWLIVLVGALLAAAGFGCGTMMKAEPMYMTSTKMYVTGVEESAPSAAGFSLGQQVLNNYIEILKSRPVLEEVIENLGLNMSYKELKNCITHNIPEGTCMIEVAVTFSDPEWAKKVADELVTVSGKRAQEIMGCSTPVVYEEANVPSSPYNVDNSSPIIYGLLGGIAGMALTGFLILVGYFANTKFSNPHKVTDKLQLKTLGVIPDSSAKNTVYGEAAYQNFCSQMLFEKPNAKIINFVSATEKENKYEFMQKAAVNLQKMDKKVLLLDTNLSNPKWGAASQGEGNQNGLETYLAGKAPLADIVVKKDGLDYIYCTQSVINGLELLGGEEFSNMLTQLKQQYDYILVDTAPMLYVPDALCVAEHAEGIVLVLSQKTSRIRQAKEIMNVLEERNLQLDGAVLKDMNISKGGKYFLEEFGKYFGVYGK